jgi:hypothetical protein
MKRLLIVLFMLISAVGFAQENVVKLGISGVGYGDFALSYERLITPKSAINLTVGYLNPNVSIIGFSNSFPFSEGLEIVGLNSGFHTSVDYKFYVGKKQAPRGIYIAPYLRYFNYNMGLNDTIDKVVFNVDTKISSIGAGFELGYHWVVYDRISIDWYFIGIGAEYMMPKLVYTTDDPDFDYQSIQQNVRDVFKGWSYFQKRLKTTHSKDNMTAKLSTFFPGVKTGLSIGFAF